MKKMSTLFFLAISVLISTESQSQTSKPAPKPVPKPVPKVEIKLTRSRELFSFQVQALDYCKSLSPQHRSIEIGDIFVSKKNTQGEDILSVKTTPLKPFENKNIFRPGMEQKVTALFQADMTAGLSVPPPAPMFKFWTNSISKKSTNLLHSVLIAAFNNKYYIVPSLEGGAAAAGGIEAVCLEKVTIP